MNSVNLSIREAVAIAQQHLQAGHRDRAEAICAQILPAVLALDPAQTQDAFFLTASCGQVLQALGHLDAAIACYRRALVLRPDFADLWGTLGGLLLQQGNSADAEPALRRALALQSTAPGLHGNLGIALCGQGRYAEAEAMLRQALHTQPNAAGIRNYLGGSMQAQGRYAEAEQEFLHALRLQPDAPGVHNNLGAALNAQGKHAGAELAFRRAVQLAPDDAAAHGSLGRALLNSARHAEAESILRRAVQLQPDDPVLHGNLGIALLNQGRHAEAGQVVQRAMHDFPDATSAQSAFLYALMCAADCSPGQYLALARRYGAALAAQARPYDAWRAEPPGSDIPVLRVGLVSGDMRSHPVGYFLESLVTQLDPLRIALVGYTNRSQEDALTARLKPHFAAWHDISALSDEVAAQKIHDDGIHVLVDLAGHTTHGRLPLFAWKPAPVQVSWLGYFASTGVPAIDFVLVDEISVRADEHAQFTERVRYLPETRLCFTPPSGPEIPAPAALPALARGHVTFGSFQNMVKLNDRVVALWARVLARVEGSRLRVQNAEMASLPAREAFLRRLAALGIAPERIELAGSMPRDAYLAAHAGVDIILDTFPYPGGTTTCEALWMGVPTLTLRGDTLLSRQGASMLTAAGLADWIADDEDDYVDRAALHAGDPAALAQLRAGMRERVRVSPLCDGGRFARHFEDALHGMWRSPDRGPSTGSRERSNE